MFDSIGPAELLVLALVGMFVLGPERLPQAIAWVAKTVQTVKDYAGGAQEKLRNELGTDFDQLRKPLDDLRSVRELDPRRAIREHLNEATSPTAPMSTPASTPVPAGVASAPAASEPATPGAAPFDDDAT